MSNKPVIIRGWWGDLDIFDGKYRKQIQQQGNTFFQKLYLYGDDKSQSFFQKEGFVEYTLLSSSKYDYRLASNHTLYDHRSLLHKLKILQKALEVDKSVLFLDWDMNFLKELDENFLSSLEGSNLQIPLYLYPKTEIEKLVNTEEDRKYFLFFTKLNDYLKKDAWIFEDSYVIPNTGFIFCNDKIIADELLNIAIKEQLTTVPDELAVLYYMKKIGYSLDDYIKNFEPIAISGKDCGNEEWNAKGKLLEKYIEEVKGVKKDLYFEHL